PPAASCAPDAAIYSGRTSPVPQQGYHLVTIPGGPVGVPQHLTQPMRKTIVCRSVRWLRRCRGQCLAGPVRLMHPRLERAGTMQRTIRAILLSVVLSITLTAAGAAHAARQRAATVTLTFGAWADTPQLAILNQIVAAYEKAHPN